MLGTPPSPDEDAPPFFPLAPPPELLPEASRPPPPLLLLLAPPPPGPLPALFRGTSENSNSSVRACFAAIFPMLDEWCLD